MTYNETINELESLKNERGIESYKKSFGEHGNYLGLGLTQLRKLAKKIKMDINLASKLRTSNYFEAKMLSFMVDDPNLYSKEKLSLLVEQLPKQYSESPISYFTMILSEYIIAKSPDAKTLTKEWSKSRNSIKRFIAFCTLGILGNVKNIDNSFFDYFLPIIESNIENEKKQCKGCYE